MTPVMKQNWGTHASQGHRYISLWRQCHVTQSVIPMAKLKDYIAFARAHCHPQLTDAAAQELVNNYVNMRRAGSSRKVLVIMSNVTLCRASHPLWGLTITFSCVSTMNMLKLTLKVQRMKGQEGAPLNREVAVSLKLCTTYKHLQLAKGRALTAVHHLRSGHLVYWGVHSQYSTTRQYMISYIMIALLHNDCWRN